MLRNFRRQLTGAITGSSYYPKIKSLFFWAGPRYAPSFHQRLKLTATHHPLFNKIIRENLNKNGRELYSLWTFSELADAARRIERDIRGEVLEIGGGRTGFPIILLLAGAERVHLNEIGPIENRFPRAMFENLNILMRLSGLAVRPLGEVMQPIPGTQFAAINPDRIVIHDHQGAEAIGAVAESIDIICSFTVYEHIADTTAVTRKMYNLLKSDGWMYHFIDLRDHRDFRNPLAFLQLSPQEAQACQSQWCNRLRSSDMIEMFVSHEFNILYSDRATKLPLDAVGSTDFAEMTARGSAEFFHEMIPEAEIWVDEAQRQQFHEDFRTRSLEDLSVIAMRVISQKA